MWRSGHFRLSEMLSACPLQRVNHFSKSGVMTNKGKLLRAHRKARSVFGKTYEFVPDSYLLPTEYTKFVRTFSEQDEKRIWICKPDNSACGRKIFLIRDLSDLKYDQQVVVQSYIERPLTIGGYKVDLRLYVLVKSFRPLEAYLYRDGLARFGTEKYDNSTTSNLNNLYAHLTNTSINKFSKTVGKNKDVIGSGCKWDFVQLKEWAVKTEGIDWHFLWSRIRHCIIMTLLLAVPVVRQEPQCFELFGFDIIIDQKLKPWLLEVNCSPALNMDEPTDRRVKPKLLKDTMTVLKHTPLTPDVLKKANDPSLHAGMNRSRRNGNSGGNNGGNGGGNGGSGGSGSNSLSRRRNSKTTSSVRKKTMANKKSHGNNGGGRRAPRATTTSATSATSTTSTTATSNNQPAPPIVLHKNVDYSSSGIGNYELLYPFNEETTVLANDICNAENDIDMQQKIKNIVDQMKLWERTVLQQQRQEQRNKMKLAAEQRDAYNRASSINGGKQLGSTVATTSRLAENVQIEKVAQMLNSNQKEQ